ncbi:MAG TPA: HupE/UreJ family protein [Longimicrobiales bacterium]|nr:HupE/UreJ family protein [Longimicrobiales bacterium]
MLWGLHANPFLIDAIIGLSVVYKAFDNIAEEGLLTNMLSFNAGVEIGQVLALMFVVIALGYWRTRATFLRHAFVTNALLTPGGSVLAGHQLVGLLMGAS